MKKRIHINRFGYMTGMPKSAVCTGTSAGLFYIVDAKQGISVYAGRLSYPSFDRESGDMVRLADFSDFNTKGSYFIRAGYRRSDVFEISDNPYDKLKKDIIGGIYLNRCGFDFYSDSSSFLHDPRYCRKGCHTEAIPNEGRRIDVAGGWHSYYGYGKSTLSAGLASAIMLYSLRLFGESFSEEEKKALEEECRWGLDWLMKMQDSDGGVFESVYTVQPGLFTAPEEDGSEYFLSKKTCDAALRFTAAAALAAGYFKGSDLKYSERLRKAAEKSWLWAVQTAEYGQYSSRSGHSMESAFMWAMCEMYSLTGDESFSQMIGKKYLTSCFTGFGDGACGGFAALSYLLSGRHLERNIEAFIRKKITDKADRMWIADRSSGYSVSLSAGGGFCFASNFHILCDCMSFITAYLLSGEKNYLTGAADQFSYILGKNPLGMAFMTGEGEDMCRYPCNSLSASNEHKGAVPGMIVSGANTDRWDEYSKWHIDRSAPPARCYIDNEYSQSTNVTAVHFSAPVIFISAFYNKVGRSALSGVRKQNLSI